jgi:hypothetical protein
MISMRYLLAALLLSALAACQATPPGKCINYLECPDGLADCHEQARDTCPGGYHVLSDADVGPDFSDFARQHFAGASTGVPHILVTCD